jgi:SAM-dependent methyltransferase
LISYRHNGEAQVKDIIENRKRIGLAAKARLAAISVRENGPLYFFYLGASLVGTRIADFGFRKSDELRRARSLPGMNSRAANKFIWDNWDWSAQGEEWTPTKTWKQSVVKTFIDPYFNDLDTILEIGPGAGRWTEYLLPRAKSLIGIDISSTCIAHCRRRFSSYPNAKFEVGSGSDLRSIGTATVDGIWSFDVFVHINSTEFDAYVREFARVLKPGAVGVIHHGTMGGSSGGWRSNVTADDVVSFMRNHGLNVVAQTKAWKDGGSEYESGLYGDAITVFTR